MAYYLDKESDIATKSEHDFWTVPRTQTTVENSYYTCILPTASGGNEGPWRFIIDSDPQFLRCANNFIYVKLSIKQANGADLAQAYHVAPINLIAKTFFKQIKLRLSGGDIYDSGDMYAYKTYFETHFVYPDDAKDTHLRAQGYYKDQVTYTPAGAAVPIDSRDNPSFRQKSQLFYNNQAPHSVEFIGYLHANLFAQDKCLPDKSKLELEVHRNSDEFCLLSYAIPAGADGVGALLPAQDYKIHVEDIKFYIMKQIVSENFRRETQTSIEKEPAKFSFRRTMQTNVHIAAGRRSAPNQIIFHGQIPRRILLGFVSSEAFYGSYGHSPFNFQPYDVRSISVKARDRRFPDDDRITMNFPSNEYLLAYRTTADALDLWNTDKSNGITLQNFKSGDTVFVIDMTPDKQDGGYFNLLTEGTLTADIEFGTAIPAGGIELVCWAEFDNILYLDGNRNFVKDYARS